MHSEIPQLDDQGLRKFGLSTGAIVVVLFAFLLPWLFELEAIPLWPWVIALALWLPALLRPALLNSVYRVWMKIGMALGWVNSRIILGLVFYVIIFPMGMLLRLFGKDPMRRKYDKSSQSYRIPSQREPRERMEKPY